MKRLCRYDRAHCNRLHAGYLDTIESCEHFIEGMDFDQFISDEKTTFAVRHALEIIGEAAKHIPEEVRKEYPFVP